MEQWHPKYLDKYNGGNENEVLAKLATASFKLTNPHTKANQEMIDKKFLFSADGIKAKIQLVSANYFSQSARAQRERFERNNSIIFL